MHIGQRTEGHAAVTAKGVDDLAGTSSPLRDWKVRMRALAVLLLLTGLLWLVVALQKYMGINSQVLSSVMLDLPFLTASVRFTWSSILLSVWTSVLSVITLHLAISGKLARPKVAEFPRGTTAY